MSRIRSSGAFLSIYWEIFLSNIPLNKTYTVWLSFKFPWWITWLNSSYAFWLSSNVYPSYFWYTFRISTTILSLKCKFFIEAKYTDLCKYIVHLFITIRIIFITIRFFRFRRRVSQHKSHELRVLNLVISATRSTLGSYLFFFLIFLFDVQLCFFTFAFFA